MNIDEIPCFPKTPLCDICYKQAIWENLVWERFKMTTEGNRGSYNLLGIERLSAQIELLERDLDVARTTIGDGP